MQIVGAKLAGEGKDAKEDDSKTSHGEWLLSCTAGAASSCVYSLWCSGWRKKDLRNLEVDGEGLNPVERRALEVSAPR